MTSLGSAAVIVASTGAAAGRTVDTTGPVIHTWLVDHGFKVGAPIVVADGAPVGEALKQEIAQGHALILTTGGTGVSASDATPEMTEPLLEKRLPGLMEEVRRAGLASTPLAVLSRGLAGVSAGTFIMNLPGSPGGVADGLRVLDPLLAHILVQIAEGGGHTGRSI